MRKIDTVLGSSACLADSLWAAAVRAQRTEAATPLAVLLSEQQRDNLCRELGAARMGLLMLDRRLPCVAVGVSLPRVLAVLPDGEVVYVEVTCD